MRLRLDEAHPGLTLEALLQNAAETEDQQFKIPPVFE
jgi:Asp-tRNA(Asn)/Glu-tRNA(Gln) amidotransferase C subunit